MTAVVSVSASDAGLDLDTLPLTVTRGAEDEREREASEGRRDQLRLSKVENSEGAFITSERGLRCEAEEGKLSETLCPSC